MVTNSQSDPRRTGLRVALWVAQILVAAVFIWAGIMKLGAPNPALSKMMPWTGQLSPNFVHFVAFVDLAGGLGMILPALTRIKPRLTVLAALGCLVLQVCALVFHFSRGEGMVTPLNFILLALSAFVLWGRNKKAPIVARA